MRSSNLSKRSVLKHWMEIGALRTGDAMIGPKHPRRLCVLSSTRIWRLFPPPTRTIYVLSGCQSWVRMEIGNVFRAGHWRWERLHRRGEPRARHRGRNHSGHPRRSKPNAYTQPRPLRDMKYYTRKRDFRKAIPFQPTHPVHKENSTAMHGNSLGTAPRA